MDNLISGILPQPGYVLVTPQEDQQQITGSQGTFRLADNVEDQESQKLGKVIAVGDSTNNDYGNPVITKIKVGDLIVHKQYGADKLKYKHQDYRFVKFQDIVGVISEA